jgi:hypothetical protein
MKRPPSGRDSAQRTATYLARAAAALRDRGVPERFWSCGELGDARLSLLRRTDDWAIAYCEKGALDVLARTAQADEAVAMFVEMVIADYENTMAGARATERWLRSKGLERP